MIVVAFALEFESAYFRAKRESQLALDVWTLGTMGMSVAQAIEQKFAISRPSLLISAGFGGGLQPGVFVGDLLIAGNYSDPGVLEKLDLGPEWRVGDLLTVPAILERSIDKQRLGEETGAVMADMETAHIATICGRHEVPMISVRCISDAMEDDMPVPADVLLNPQTGRPEPLLLFRHLITKPSSVVGFNQLVKNARTAQAGLAHGLEDLLPQLLRM